MKLGDPCDSREWRVRVTGTSKASRRAWRGIVLAWMVVPAGCGPSGMEQGQSFALVCPGGRVVGARLVNEGDQVLLKDRASMLVLPRTAEGVYDDNRAALRFAHDGRAVLGLKAGRARAIVCRAVPGVLTLVPPREGHEPASETVREHRWTAE
jgi:hypothetical protein